MLTVTASFSTVCSQAHFTAAPAPPLLHPTSCAFLEGILNALMTQFGSADPVFGNTVNIGQPSPVGFLPHFLWMHLAASPSGLPSSLTHPLLTVPGQRRKSHGASNFPCKYKNVGGIYFSGHLSNKPDFPEKQGLCFPRRA